MDLNRCAGGRRWIVGAITAWCSNNCCNILVVLFFVSALLCDILKVVLMDQYLAPGMWIIGRVTATVKMMNGIYESVSKR